MLEDWGYSLENPDDASTVPLDRHNEVIRAI